MNKTVKMFKSRVRFLLEHDDIQGFLLFDEPPFEYQGDISLRLFENPLEGVLGSFS
ncbi:MAG: hypothetical protein LBE10_06920 [Treponema sp.]|jgi:hypothetical protein|nr:hypothetical protein [Treponema sp.]